jgi:hypothetical protein
MYVGYIFGVVIYKQLRVQQLLLLIKFDSES